MLDKNNKLCKIILFLIIFIILFSTISINAIGPQLLIFKVTSSPEEIYEMEEFTITVTSSSSTNNDPLINVKILFEWDKTVYYTDENGEVTIIAPEIIDDTDYWVNISKGGYETQNITITVINKPNLEIDLPDSGKVNENEEFILVISDDKKNIVPNVKVLFYNESGYTGDSQVDYSDESGQVVFTAPNVKEDTLHYIKAEKEGYISREDSIIIVNVEEPATVQLEIDTQEMADEKTEFIVTIYVEGNVVSDATVTLDNQIEITDINGVVTFKAPEVDDNKKYKIYASHPDYSPDTEIITVNNIPKENEEENQSDNQENTKAKLYGLIYEEIQESINPLTNVIVCAKKYDEKNVLTSKCVQTDTNGEYQILLPEGTYNLEVRKNEYKTVIEKNIQIQKDKNYRFNISLIKEPKTSNSIDQNDEFIRGTINNAVTSGDVGAEIYYTDKNNYEINYYGDYNIDVIETSETDELISCIVGAESGTPGTMFIFHLDREQFKLNDNKREKVIFDGVELPRMTIDEFENPSTLETEKYIVLGVEEGLYIGVYTTHFSEHTITISTIPSQILQYLPFFIIAAIIICIIMAIIFIKVENEDEGYIY